MKEKRILRSGIAVLLAACALTAVPAEPAYAKSLATHYTRDTNGRYTRVRSGVYERNAVSRRYTEQNGTYVLKEEAGQESDPLIRLDEAYPDHADDALYLYDPVDRGDTIEWRASFEPDGSSDGEEGNGSNLAFSGEAESFAVRIRKDAPVSYEFYEDGQTFTTSLFFRDFARVRTWRVDEAGNLTYQLCDEGQMREHTRISDVVQDENGVITSLSASNRDQNHQ